MYLHSQPHWARQTGEISDCENSHYKDLAATGLISDSVLLKFHQNP